MRACLISVLLCHCDWFSLVFIVSGKLASSVQVVQALQVEDKVAQRAPIDKFERTLVFPLFLRGTKLFHDFDDLSLFKEEIELEIVARNFNLHGLESTQRHFPLHSSELGLRACLVKVSLDIDHEPIGKDNEPSLVHEVGVSLDNEGVALIAVIFGKIAVFLEKILPVDG